MSRNEQITPIHEVSAFLAALDQDRFWDVHSFPEIAELRAVRFHNMNGEIQKSIVSRIQKGPPRSHWPKKVNATELQNVRLYRSLRELRRIEIGGGILPDRAKAWFDARSIQFRALVDMPLDEGFPGEITVSFREAKPDTKFDPISDFERLKALELALGTSRRGWDDDPAECANDWINQQGNIEKLLADFENTKDGGNDFPKVWNRFCWAHRPRQQDGQTDQDESLNGECTRVLGLLSLLSETTLSSAIEGICAWLNAWEKQAVKSPLTLPIWLRLWPLAVNNTNRKPEAISEMGLSVTAFAAYNNHETTDLNTLNSSAGKLVGVFIAACPPLTPGVETFINGSMEKQMRDVVIAAEGRSGLISKHLMIEALPYFLHADRRWAQEFLIVPLLKDDGAAITLWRAVARRTHFTEVLKIIGMPMVERANDRRLDRETRRRLIFSVVIESLHAFREDRDPAVPNQCIQQMLRKLEDELRASAANAIQVFVRDLSAKTSPDRLSPRQEDLFRASAAPFLHEVWPQERSLATPGVSSALADLPATSGEAFAQAVDTISRFLVPFECWSMINYGLYDGDGETKRLALINDEPKARALLKLLDLTVGSYEGAVIPYDLTKALDQITLVDARLSTTSTFRRLAAAARR